MSKQNKTLQYLAIENKIMNDYEALEFGHGIKAKNLYVGDDEWHVLSTAEESKVSFDEFGTSFFKIDDTNDKLEILTVNKQSHLNLG